MRFEILRWLSERENFQDLREMDPHAGLVESRLTLTQD